MRALRARQLAPIIVAVIGVALSVLLWRLAVAGDSQAKAADFQLHAQHRISALDQEITQSLNVLHSLAAFYSAHGYVERRHFQEFAQSAVAGHSSIQALEWIPRVRFSERADYERAAVRDGFDSFEFTERDGETLVTAAARDEYYPVYFVEPLRGNEATLGFDLASDPTRLEALEQARDSGDQVATGRIRLVQEAEGQAGFLVFQPIYEQSGPTNSIQQRRDSLIGFVLGVYRVGDIVTSAFAGDDQKPVETRLVDRTSPTDPAPLFSSAADEALDGSDAALTGDTDQDSLHASGSIDVAGRRWQILLTPGPGYGSAGWSRPWFVLLAGLAFAALASLFLAHSVRRGIRLHEALVDAEEAKETLRESEAKYRDLVESISVAAFIFRGTRIIYVNSAAEAMTGYTREELLKMDFWDVIHPDFRELAKERGEARQRGEQAPLRYEVKLLTKSGEERWVDYTAGVIEFEGGPAVLGTAFDITERRRAEEEARLAKERLHHLVSTSPAVIYSAMASGDYGATFISENVTSQMGYEPHEFVEDPEFWISHVHPEDAARVLADLQHVFQEGLYAQEYRFLHKDGTYRWMRDELRLIRDEDGNALEVVGYWIDITERKRAEEELQARTHDLGERVKELGCLYGISHLVEQQGISLDEILQGVADLIPPAWQYPEVTCGRVILEGQEYRTGNFRETPWKQACDIAVDGEPLGAVEVYYLEERPESDEGPFLKEERSLMVAIAERVGDITERKRAEEALQDSEARLQEAQRIAHLGNWDWNIETSALWWSDEIYRIFGLAPQEFRATYDAFVNTIHPDDRESVEDAVNKALNERTPYSIDHRIVLPDGSGRVVHEQGEVTYDEAGKPVRMVGTVLDITERNRFQAQLEHAANYDSLTNLPNRRRFEDELERQLAQACRNGQQGALVFLDLDQFKDVNDSLGHWAGDELLILLAGRLREERRKDDTLARLGGDEFGILLPDTDLRQASAVAARLLQSVRDRPFDISGHRISITASIGIVMFPGPGTTAGEVLAQADLAMYQAKELGRDRFHACTPDRDWQAETESRLNWRNRIHEALETDRFLLHAQPILDLSRNEVSQYELLLRMTTEDGKILLPAEFLGIAERSGSMAAIERWVVRRAIQLIAEQSREGREPCLEVNLSARAFAEQEMVALIRQELAVAGVNPASLVFEVTETTAVRNITEAQEFVASLKALGCRFALDDFGTGISSFYLLKHLPVDYLKIDGSFVRDLPGSPVDQHLVRMMAEVAKGLGIKTIAEQVADEETLRLLREYGIDYAQGYHVGRPGPVSDVLSATGARAARAA